MFKQVYHRSIIVITFFVLSLTAERGGNVAIGGEKQGSDSVQLRPVKPHHQFMFADQWHAPSIDSVLKIYDYPRPSEEVVKQRLDSLNMTINLEMNRRIYSFIEYFTIRNRDYSKMVLRREKMYFPAFERILAKHNMPDEIKYLSVVESGLNPLAKSPAGAVGLWQFMERTGKSLSLDVNWKVDERRDPLKSTEAACVYLKQLYNMFDDWELAMAAYNCGPGNVRKAIRRSGYKNSFWEVYRYLPRETRSYVPQFVAIIYMMNYHKEHDLHPEYYEKPMAAHSVKVDHYLDLNILAEEIGVCIEDLKKLNPTLKTNYLPDNKQYALRIPADKTEHFHENYCAIIEASSKNGVRNYQDYHKPSPRISTSGKTRIVHRVHRGEYLGSIAARYHVRISHVRHWNNLRGNTIYPGQKLVVYTKHPPRQRQHASKNKNAKSSGVYYVQPGDSLWSISRKYKGVTVNQLRKINGLNSNTLKPGQKLKLMDKG